MLKCESRKFNFICKVVPLIMLSCSISLLPVVAFAQGGDLPCGGDDPTTSTPCPLDGWVWLLAIAAILFGAIYLQRQRRITKNA